MAIPESHELVPPLEVKPEGLRQGDDLLHGGGRGAEVNHAPGEGPASRDHLGSEAEHANEGE